MLKFKDLLSLSTAVIPLSAMTYCTANYVEPPLTDSLKKGKVIVHRDCAVCHVQGLRDAPLLGNHEAWAPRIAKGEDALLKNAISGYNMMPSRGANPELSDEELLLAIRYMTLVSQQAD